VKAALAIPRSSISRSWSTVGKTRLKKASDSLFDLGPRHTVDDEAFLARSGARFEGDLILPESQDPRQESPDGPVRFAPLRWGANSDPQGTAVEAPDSFPGAPRAGPDLEEKRSIAFNEKRAELVQVPRVYPRLMVAAIRVRGFLSLTAALVRVVQARRRFG